jgi:hypothetical protein
MRLAISRSRCATRRPSDGPWGRWFARVIIPLPGRPQATSRGQNFVVGAEAGAPKERVGRWRNGPTLVPTKLRRKKKRERVWESFIAPASSASLEGTAHLWSFGPIRCLPWRPVHPPSPHLQRHLPPAAAGPECPDRAPARLSPSVASPWRLPWKVCVIPSP